MIANIFTVKVKLRQSFRYINLPVFPVPAGPAGAPPKFDLSAPVNVK